MTTLETDRLVLRGWRDDDLDVLAAINADPEVMRYILDGAVRDRQQTAAGLQKMQDDWRAQGYGMFAVEVRGTGELIGQTGLAAPHFLPSVMPAVEIGWRLGRAAWGRGYATEAAEAALRFGFDGHGLDRVISIRHVENVRSERVMEKLGLSYESADVIPGCDQPVAIYAITRDRYDR